MSFNRFNTKPIEKNLDLEMNYERRRLFRNLIRKSARRAKLTRIKRDNVLEYDYDDSRTSREIKKWFIPRGF